ncbi:RNA dependent RNA polymerase [Paenibacillus pinihumi]|uniref:RNA dependent RNA polymerase n=1 Tax=Paenibacillus pinihumi TaxID=669462 RepID=UPI00048C7832|nr:hypothetical protein [Paenibacillus pinihumi]
MKQRKQNRQHYIFKIHTTRLKNNDWSLNLTPEEARSNNEVVAVSDSQAISFVRELAGHVLTEDKLEAVELRIRTIKQFKSGKASRQELVRLFQRLDELLFIQDYLFLVVDSHKDFDRANQGFLINGRQFHRLYGTANGVKKGTIVYVSDRVYAGLSKKINNGRNLSVPLVPAKLEAYKALASSASQPVTEPGGMIVAQDYVHTILADIVRIRDGDLKIPVLSEEIDYEVSFNINDGYGLISPELSRRWADDLGLTYLPAGFCIRNSFMKGMLFTFDFHKFAREIAGSDEITDVWGDRQFVFDAQLIVTASMLKLWGSYTNMEHYLECCRKSGYTFRVTKATPEKLENCRNLNYQFIQSLPLTEEALDRLIEPTVNDIKAVLGDDWRKSLLFLKGTHLTDKHVTTLEYDFAQALMAAPEMIRDPFVRAKIRERIDKRIQDAKLGQVKVQGNYSIIAGDPYALCQSLFGITVTGLLRAGEFYSAYWNEKKVKKAACFRAPMTCHNNNRILRFKKTSEMLKWYRYMDTVTIFNSWDTTTHALNGADMDECTA